MLVGLNTGEAHGDQVVTAGCLPVQDNAAFAVALPSATPIQFPGRSGRAAIDASAARSTEAMLVRRQSTEIPGADRSTSTRLVLAADATADRGLASSSRPWKAICGERGAMALSASDTAMFMVAAIRPWTVGPAQPEIPASSRNAFQFATVLPDVKLTVDCPRTSWAGAAKAALGTSRTEAVNNATSPCPVRLSDARCHVLKPNDFYSVQKWRTSPMNREFGIPGQSWEMAVYFPDEPGHRMRLMLWRGRTRDFSERDRLLLTLLRPHLIAAYRTA